MTQVFDGTGTGLVLRECAPGVTEDLVRAATAAPLAGAAAGHPDDNRK